MINTGGKVVPMQGLLGHQKIHQTESITHVAIYILCMCIASYSMFMHRFCFTNYS